jgi:hypothetical protein
MHLNSAILSINLGNYALQPHARSFLNTRESSSQLANNDLFKDSTNTQGGNGAGLPAGWCKQLDTPSASQPLAKKSKLRDTFRDFLARIHTDRVIVAHEFLHQFMVHYQYIVPCEDLEDLKNLV